MSNVYINIGGGGIKDYDFDTGWVKLFNKDAYVSTGQGLYQWLFQCIDNDDHITVRVRNDRTYIKGLLTRSNITSNNNNYIFYTNDYNQAGNTNGVYSGSFFNPFLIPDEMSINEEFNTNLENVKIKVNYTSGNNYGYYYVIGHENITTGTKLKFDIEFFYDKNFELNKKKNVYRYLNFKYLDSLKFRYDVITYK